MFCLWVSVVQCSTGTRQRAAAAVWRAAIGVVVGGIAEEVSVSLLGWDFSWGGDGVVGL